MSDNFDGAAEDDLPSDIDGEPMSSDSDNDSTHSDQPTKKQMMQTMGDYLTHPAHPSRQ